MADKFLLNDRVWDFRHGWGKVTEIRTGAYPVHVIFDANREEETYSEDGKSHKNDIRPSLLFDQINMEGVMFERPRWKADVGNSYFCIDTAGEVVKYTQGDSSYDAKRYKAKNYFQTREEAEESSIYEVFNGGR